MKHGKAAALAPSTWAKNSEDRKKIVVENEVIFPIAFSAETGQPYMDAQNFVETGKREEVKRTIQLPDENGESKELSINVTLVEYKYTSEKGEVSKFWIPLAPAQKDVVEYFKLAKDIERLARAFKTYTNLTLSTNPVILTSGIIEIGTAHALALAGKEITKEIEELMEANLRGTMSATEVGKEIHAISNKILSNYIELQADHINSVRYSKALEEVIKIMEKNGSTSANLLAMQAPLGKSDMNPVITNHKVDTKVTAIDPNGRSEKRDRSNISFI